jgi:hypothetical protein
MSKKTGLPGPMPSARIPLTASSAFWTPCVSACPASIGASPAWFAHGACSPT